jgi:hypothetical protein
MESWTIQPISPLEELLVYPNPVDGELHLRFESNRTAPLTVSVFNSMGEAILILPDIFISDDVVPYTIDLPDLSAGIYTLHVVSGNEFWTRKVVVAH